MPVKYLLHKSRQFRQIPLWQRIIILFLVIAMPLFFAFVRMTGVQRTVDTKMPAVERNS
jgi:hypothetical protein